MERDMRKQQDRRKPIDEEKILKEIEDSFCVAGYEIVESNIFKEQINEVKKQN